MDTTVEIILGKDLNKNDLDTINYHRKKEFNSKTDIRPAPDNDDWEKPYILVRNEEDKLVSFGRLHNLTVRFRGADYPILGIASVLSIEKRKGYGRMVLEAMKKYAQEKKMTAVGFCDPEDSQFYQKCGLNVIEGMDRFEFPSGPKSAKPGITVYINKEDGLMREMKKYPRDKVTTFRDEW